MLHSFEGDRKMPAFYLPYRVRTLKRRVKNGSWLWQQQWNSQIVHLSRFLLLPWAESAKCSFVPSLGEGSENLVQNAYSKFLHILVRDRNRSPSTCWYQVPRITEFVYKMQRWCQSTQPAGRAGLVVEGHMGHLSQNHVPRFWKLWNKFFKPFTLF